MQFYLGQLYLNQHWSLACKLFFENIIFGNQYWRQFLSLDFKFDSYAWKYAYTKTYPYLCMTSWLLVESIGDT